MYLKIKVISYN